MQVRRQYAVVRWTHLPTGVTAQADGQDHAGNIRDRVRWAHAIARKHLLAKLCRPTEPANPVRLYHLDPRPGVEPLIKQGDKRLAEGREAVLAVLAGQLPETTA